MSEARVRISVTRIGALVVAALALAVVTLMSLRIGSFSVTTEDAVNAVFDYSPESYEETVVRSLRIPRTIIGIGVGAALGVAGAAMQAVNRNPLAAPSILGVNSGAAFGVVTAVFFADFTHPFQFIWFAFAGGLAASLAVYAISSAGQGGVSPVKLVLAGVVVSAVLGSWLTALLLLDQQTLDIVRFWLAGSLAGRDINVFFSVLPFFHRRRGLHGDAWQSAQCSQSRRRHRPLVGYADERYAGTRHTASGYPGRQFGRGRWSYRLCRTGGSAHGAGGFRSGLSLGTCVLTVYWTSSPSWRGHFGEGGHSTL